MDNTLYHISIVGFPSMKGIKFYSSDLLPSTGDVLAIDGNQNDPQGKPISKRYKVLWREINTKNSVFIIDHEVILFVNDINVDKMGNPIR